LPRVVQPSLYSSSPVSHSPVSRLLLAMGFLEAKSHRSALELEFAVCPPPLDRRRGPIHSPTDIDHFLTRVRFTLFASALRHSLRHHDPWGDIGSEHDSLLDADTVRQIREVCKGLLNGLCFKVNTIFSHRIKVSGNKPTEFGAKGVKREPFLG
jgi:hypothetical protein